MRIVRCLIVMIIMAASPFVEAQGETLSEKIDRIENNNDSLVTMRELHRMHREERKARGPRRRLDMGADRRTAEDVTGRQTVLSLRTNLLRWLTFTPELGLVWHCAPRVDIQLNAAWTSMSVSDRYKKRYALWMVSPEARYYLGQHQRYYVGIQGELGERDYRLRGRDQGKKGRVWGCGLTGGYQWRLSRHTSLDLHLGVGYNAGRMEHYDYEIVKYHQERFSLGDVDEHRFGINHLGVSLVWDLFGRKRQAVKEGR